MKRSNRLLKQLALSAALTLLPAVPAFCIHPGNSSAVQASGFSADGLTFTEYTESTSENTSENTAGLPAESSTETLPAIQDVYHVLETDSGEVLEISLREYLIGALCAEMPLSFETEALKAQVVAAHTYAERQARIAASRDDPDLKGADFSDDPACYQAFYTDAQLHEIFGDSYEANYRTAAAAVDAVLPEILTFEEQPILAAFHAISSGKTESASNVWGSDVAYLRSVDSTEDKNAPSFEETAEFSQEEAAGILTGLRPGIVLSEDPADWFGDPVCSEAGTVLQLQIGSGIFTGQELRTAFSLRSAAFTVSRNENGFTFTTHGYGHDVGMSQYGANAMAKAGADYREILSHYYNGASITAAVPSD